VAREGAPPDPGRGIVSTIPVLAAAMASLLVRCWPPDPSASTRERDEQALWLVAAVLALLVG
jgi:hypothetical protein